MSDRPRDDVVDLTRGYYRRVFGGLIASRAVCGVSLEAEAWLTRILCVADDFGNADADPLLLHQATAGRRADKVTPDDVGGWVRELADGGLVDLYEVDGEPFMHVRGFLRDQVAPRNGRRVRRHPQWPGEASELAQRPDAGSPGASGGVRGSNGATGGVRANPGAYQYQDQNQNHHQDQRKDPRRKNEKAVVAQVPREGRRNGDGGLNFAEAVTREYEQAHASKGGGGTA